MRRSQPGWTAAQGDAEADADNAPTDAAAAGESMSPQRSIRQNSRRNLIAMARFFIDRPVLGVVISAVILLAGLAAVKILPIAQYPEITPPTVQVSCSYPGASATVVRDTVAAPIEQQVNGVESMLYMSSQCTNDGGYNLTVTFELGTNLDMAQVLVQNRVNLALPSLPDAVKATGVSTKKKSPSILLVVNLYVRRRPGHEKAALRPALPEQLRDDSDQGRAGPAQRRGRRRLSGPAGLQHAGLARSREAGGEQPDGQRRDQRAERTKRPGCRRADRTAAGPAPDRIFSTRSARWAGWSRPSSSTTSSSRRGRRDRSSGCATFRAANWGPKNQDTRCTLDGKPSVGLAIYQLPGSNALETAEKHPRPDEGAGRSAFPTA